MAYAPRIGTPSSWALDRFMSTTAAAPSETCDAFPAVVDPPSWKAAFSLASFSGVEPGRGPSSVSTT